MSGTSMPTGSPSRPRSRSSSKIISASASGTPVWSGIAPRIGGTQARQLDSGSHGQYSWWWRAAEPKSHRIGSSSRSTSAKRMFLSRSQVPIAVLVM